MIYWLLILLSFSGLFLYLAMLWRAIPESLITTRDIPISIVVPIRNELVHLEKLLNSIAKQQYELDKIELILVDDHSDDGSYELALDLAKKHSFSIQVVRQNAKSSGKKAAATLGVSLAVNDFILCTDSDCVFNQDWIASMVGPLAKRDLMMVSGPVRMDELDTFQQLQQLEFSGLIAFGGLTLSNNYASMCNGANMAYRKKAFEAVKGYQGNDHIPSGDDEFLLQKISNAYPGRVAFIKAQGAIVSTRAKGTFGELWNQRLRWAGKWRFHRSGFINLLVLMSAVLFSLLLIAPVILFINSWKFGLAGMLLLFIGEFYFFWQIMRFLGNGSNWRVYVGLSLIYPIYALILGVASTFGSYSWKGRNY
ncbi:MAG: biofilm PGA synthesis N-glycosyltransferase PgaC [Cyclobacteriaceae bacterium]|jgi:biofilm PGA synthesis N-glycosyltransferase PgaC